MGVLDRQVVNIHLDGLSKADRISAIYQSFPLDTSQDGVSPGSIRLAGGETFRLGELSELFAPAFELGFLVASLQEHSENDDVYSTDMIVKAERWLVELIREKVHGQGFFMTNPFGPGQGSIPLEMQAPLLDILKAKEIDVSLADNYVMQPLKTVTGIFGIQNTPPLKNIRPCDVCKLSKTCPKAYL